MGPEVERIDLEKLPRAPIGKDRLPTTIFQGRAVKLQGRSIWKQEIGRNKYDLNWAVPSDEKMSNG